MYVYVSSWEEPYGRGPLPSVLVFFLLLHLAHDSLTKKGEIAFFLL
jgi:hypothetical protein